MRRWTSRTIYVGGVSVSLFTDPDGQRWVMAGKREKHDRRVRMKHGLPPCRLRKFEQSGVARRLKREGVDVSTL